MGASSQTPGGHLAVLRKSRGLSQAGLARKAAISPSLLTKIERGDHTLTPAVAAAVGRALGLSMAAVLGKTPAPPGSGQLLAGLLSPA